MKPLSNNENLTQLLNKANKIFIELHPEKQHGIYWYILWFHAISLLNKYGSIEKFANQGTENHSWLLEKYLMEKVVKKSNVLHQLGVLSNRKFELYEISNFQ